MSILAKSAMALLIVIFPGPARSNHIYLEIMADTLAASYSVDPALCRCVIEAESRWHPSAVGDHGKAIGLVQWHPESWRLVRKHMGLDPDPALRINPEASVDAMLYAWTELGLQHWWSTYGDCRIAVSDSISAGSAR